MPTTTHAEKMLTAIEAWLEGKDPGVAEYEISGRRMKYIPMAELLKLRNYYRAEARRATAAASYAAGTGDPRRVFVRFGG